MPDRDRPTPPPNLGLAGDVHDMVRDIEQAFGVDFGVNFGSWSTVGDIEAALAPLFPADTARGPCAAAMAFYTLRRGLGLPRSVGPGMRLATLRLGSRSGTLARLEHDLRLRMPKALPSRLGRFGTALLLFGLICAIQLFEMGAFAWLAWAIVAEGALLRQADLGSFKAMTLGELARAVALLNYGAFAARGADRRPETIWRVLRHIVCCRTSVDPNAISRETRLRADRKGRVAGAARPS